MEPRYVIGIDLGRFALKDRPGEFDRGQDQGERDQHRLGRAGQQQRQRFAKSRRDHRRDNRAGARRYQQGNRRVHPFR